MTVRVVPLGGQRIDGVWFLPKAGRPTGPHRLHATARADVEHLSTDDLTRTAHIRRALVERIGEAEQKVLFCSFLFADDEIVNALCAAAERLHGGVYVLTALGKHLRAEVLELDADVDANTAKQQERAKRHNDHLQRLAHAGVWLRSAEDCHAKFCVIDDQLLVVTSANATQEAYESNPEDALVVRGPLASRELGRLFAYVWRHLATLESTPGDILDVHSLPPRAPPAWHALPLGGQLDSVATLRRHEGSLQRAAIEIVDGATSRLDIATYSLIGMEAHPIGDALKRAVERGVQIRVLLQPRNHVAGQRATCAWLVGLSPERVQLHGHRRTHTKSIVADGRCALLWTGNLEAAHGWADGIEVGLRIVDVGVATAIQAWTTDVIDRSTHVALLSPTVDELIARGQPQAMTGDWNLQLPPGATLDWVAGAIEQHPLELLEHRGAQVLRAGNVLIEVQLDEAARRIDARLVRSGECFMASKNLGWVSGGRLRLLAPPHRHRAKGQKK